MPVLLITGGVCAVLGAVAQSKYAKRKEDKAAAERKKNKLPRLWTELPKGVQLDCGDKKVNILDHNRLMKIIWVGLPDPCTTTTTTSVTQIEEYMNSEEELRVMGVDEVIVWACTDASVMTAWGKKLGVEGSIVTMMADPDGTLCKRLGVKMNGGVGAPRCQRHAILATDGVIKAVEVAASKDDPTGDVKPDVSSVKNMLTKITGVDTGAKAQFIKRWALQKPIDREEAEKAIKLSDLVLFVKPGCPLCKEALETLQDAGFNPRVVEETRSQHRGLQYITNNGHWKLGAWIAEPHPMPSCWVKGSYVGGCNDGFEPWHGVKPLVANGGLRKLLDGKSLN